MGKSWTSQLAEMSDIKTGVNNRCECAYLIFAVRELTSSRADLSTTWLTASWSVGIYTGLSGIVNSSKSQLFARNKLDFRSTAKVKS